MVSLKDIATECGVSVATVSKALNGHSDISEATRERISSIAKEMGYLPNSAARALKTNRTKNIGVLFVDGLLNGLTHDYFARILNSFKQEIEAQGYDMTFINSSSREDSMTYLEHARYRRFDGVFMACIDFNDPQVLELVNSDIPIVTVDYAFNGKSAVMSDNVDGMRKLLTYIYEQGHRKIAYIHGLDSGVTRARLATFYQMAEQYGVTVPDQYIKECEYRDIAACAEKTKELLALTDRPTCILFPDDYSGLGGAEVIREAGLTAPEDISFAGYDGLEIVRYLTPSFTTLAQDTTATGVQAARQMMSLIEHPKATIPGIITVYGELFPGGTVGPVKK